MSRKVRVATVALQKQHEGTVEANRNRVLGLLDLACADRPDIVCLPECFATQGVKGDLKTLAEPVPGPTTDAAALRAKKHRSYVVCPLYRRNGESVFNSAVLIDRDGQVAGIYDKMHHANTSWRAFRERERPVFEAALGPAQAPVFDLDFGKVGVQICFDLSFPEGWDQLADKGAELVFWTSAFDGGFHLRAMAYLHDYYIVSSVQTSHASIINPLGEVLERTGWCSVAARTIDLDFMVCYFDWHRERIDEMKRKYGDGVTVRVLSEEGHFLLEASRDGLSVRDLAREFRIDSNRDFHRWHTNEFKALREGRAESGKIT